MNKLIKFCIVALALVATVSVAEARTLTVGSTGADVVSLQTWLIDNGYPIPLIESGRAAKGYFGEQTKTAVEIYQEERGELSTGIIDSNEYSRPSTPILGAASPDFGPYIAVGGVRLWGRKQFSLTQGSSTVCSLQAPQGTSTLVHGSVNFNLASTSAVTVDLAKSANGFSTTTLIGTTAMIGASATPVIVASTTDSAAAEALIFAPNSYFVIRINQLSAGNGLGNAPVGMCQALWAQI